MDPFDANATCRPWRASGALVGGRPSAFFATSPAGQAAAPPARSYAVPVALGLGAGLLVAYLRR